MTDQTSSKQTDTPLSQENSLSLYQWLSLRLAYERATTDLYEHFVEKYRSNKDPVIRAMNVTPFESFRHSLTDHIHLLAQAMDVVSGRTANDRDEGGIEAFLAIANAAQAQAADPQTCVLPCMQALLTLEQRNDVDWGLLLALIKDVELDRFVAPVEQACARHAEQRALLQHYYEDIALGLMRRHHAQQPPVRSTRQRTTGRFGIFVGGPRYMGRI